MWIFLTILFTIFCKYFAAQSSRASIQFTAVRNTCVNSMSTGTCFYKFHGQWLGVYCTVLKCNVVLHTKNPKPKIDWQIFAVYSEECIILTHWGFNVHFPERKPPPHSPHIVCAWPEFWFPQWITAGWVPNTKHKYLSGLFSTLFRAGLIGL